MKRNNMNPIKEIIRYNKNNRYNLIPSSLHSLYFKLNKKNITNKGKVTSITE